MGMNKEEARRLIDEVLVSYREKPYEALRRMIGGETVTGELKGPSGTRYQFEIDTFWDDRPDGNIRVLGAIDDGGWRAYLPLCSDFIKAPDDSFVAE